MPTVMEKKERFKTVKLFFILFSLLFSGVFSVWNVLAQNRAPNDSVPPYTDEECEKLIILAENKDMDWVYRACGFQDKKKIENKWELFARRSNLKKALFNICLQDINNDFYFLNCRKAADLGSREALKFMADRQYDNGYYKEAYDLYLKAVSGNELLKRGFILSSEDKLVIDSYYRLAVILLQGEGIDRPPEETEKEAFNHLQNAVRFGHKEASKIYGLYTLLGLSGQHPKDITEGQRYLFRAVLKGCPLAQEALAYPYLIKAQKITSEELADRLSDSLFTCSASFFSQEHDNGRLSDTYVQKTQEQCDCASLQQTYRQEARKPYRIISIQGQKAVLDASFGQEILAEVGTKLPDGFEVMEIRSQAVIVQKPGDRQVLLLNPNQECLDVCFENLGLIHLPTFVSAQTPYQIRFTPFECRQLAYYANEFISGDEDFFGKKECRFDDPQVWSDYFKEQNYQKMLYLVNKSEGNYPSAVLNRAEEIYETDFPRREKEFSALVTQAAEETPLDRQAHFDQAEAYCLNGMMQMINQPTQNEAEAAYEWNRQGLQKGFPHSINLIGIQYAKGLGVEQDLQMAKQLFKTADDLYKAPFFAARHNLNILEKGGSLDDLDYGKCADYGQPQTLDETYFKKIKEIYLDEKIPESSAPAQ